MTGKDFNALYEIGQCISSSSIASYLAHVAATHRLVMVHRLGSANDGERRRIAALLHALPTRRTTVLARLDVDDEPVIVTEFLPDFVNLRDWLEAAVAVQTTVVIRTGLPTPPLATPRADTATPWVTPTDPTFASVAPPPIVPPFVAPDPSPVRPRAQAGPSGAARRRSLLPLIVAVMAVSVGALAVYLALRG